MRSLEGAARALLYLRVQSCVVHDAHSTSTKKNFFCAPPPPSPAGCTLSFTMEHIEHIEHMEGFHSTLFSLSSFFFPSHALDTYQHQLSLWPPSTIVPTPHSLGHSTPFLIQNIHLYHHEPDWSSRADCSLPTSSPGSQSSSTGPKANS